MFRSFIRIGEKPLGTWGEQRNIYLGEFVEEGWKEEGRWSIYPQSRRCFSRDIRDTRSPPAGSGEGRIVGRRRRAGVVSRALMRLRPLSDVADGVSCAMTSTRSFVIARRRHGGCTIYFRFPPFAPFVSCRPFSSRLPLLPAPISILTRDLPSSSLQFCFFFFFFFVKTSGLYKIFYCNSSVNYVISIQVSNDLQ